MRCLLLCTLFAVAVLSQIDGSGTECEEVINVVIRKPKCEEAIEIVEKKEPASDEQSLPFCEESIEIMEAPEETEEASSSTEEKSSANKDKTVNWDSDDILFEKEQNKDQEPTEKSELCPSGWILFETSCYWMSEDQLSMDKAERQCNQMKTTLFVANTKKEWDTIRVLAPVDKLSWIGMFKEDEEKITEWQTKDGMDYEQMNWLLPNVDSISNGWSTVSRCAAYFNPAAAADHYTHFYPCQTDYHYICERNATLFAN